VARPLGRIHAAGDLGDGVLNTLQVDIQETFPSVYNAVLPPGSGNYMRRIRRFLPTIALTIVLAGCSSSPKPAEKPAEAKAEPPKVELLTGRVAFQKLFVTARSWAPDAQPFRLESESAKQAPGTDGKAGVWRGYFASASKRALKPYLWSGISGPDAPERGISPGTEDTFNPANTSTRPFDFGFLKTDSDKAFEVAQAHGGKKLLEANPQQPVKYELLWNPSTNELLWHVIYGTSEMDAKLRIAVDASTGTFLKVEK
jgi:hypothetical protein